MAQCIAAVFQFHKGSINIVETLNKVREYMKSFNSIKVRLIYSAKRAGAMFL